MTSTINKPNEIQVENITYKEPKTIGNGGKQVYVEYNDSKLIVQTPKMTLPWSMGKFDGDQGLKFSIDMSFKGMDTNEQMRDFHKFLDEFDDILVKQGVKHSMAWFKKKDMKEEVLKALFSKQLKESKDKDTGEPDGKWPPTLKVKLPYKNDKFTCEIYDNKKNMIDTEQLESILVRGCEVQALIEHTGIWFAGGKYGCSWKVIQMKVTAPSTIKGYSFIDSSDDEDVVDEEVVTVNESGSKFVEDSDSDIVESDEDIPSPPLKQKKKK